MEISDEAYKKLVLEVAAARGMPERPRRLSLGGILFTLACLIPIALLVARIGPEVAVMYGVKVPLAGTPQVVFSTPAPQPAGGGQPALVPFYRGTEAPVAVEAPTGTPEPTHLPAAAADTHLTAIAIKFAPTETAQIAEWKVIEGPYFYDPYTLATPEAGFGGYVDEQCQDKEKVKKSWMLQQMCAGE